MKKRGSILVVLMAVLLILLCFPPGRAFAQTSLVTTLSYNNPGISDNGSFSVILNGSIMPGLNLKAYGFYWSTDPNNITQNYQNAGSSKPLGGSFSCTLNNLAEGTTYYYEAVITFTDGSTATGDVMDFSAPIVTTSGATNVTDTSTTLNGGFNGEFGIIGVDWEAGALDNNEKFATIYDGTLHNGIPIDWNGNASYNLTGLTPGTTYYFAFDGVGAFEVVGTMMSFTTSWMATEPASGITATSATLTGNIDIQDYNGATTDYGFYWGTSNTPATRVQVGTNDWAGYFYDDLAGLAPGTTYYYQAYAVNSAGESRGAVMSFTTPVTRPTVYTMSATNVVATFATLNGSIDNNGGLDITDYGFYWGTDSSNLTNQVQVGTTNCSGFSYDLTGLNSGATYYFQAYAVNSVGESKGNVMSFYTASGLPVAATLPATNITAGSVTLNGAIENNGGSDITDYGFYWGTNQATLVSSGHRVDVDYNASGTSLQNGSFSYNCTGLTPGTTYYFQAFADNSYGENQIATIQSFTYAAPIVTTENATNITATSVTLNGSIDNSGRPGVTDYGFYYGASSNNLTTQGTKVQVGTNDQGEPFSSNLTSLTPGTTYYFQAYAVNPAGEGDAAPLSFTTGSVTITTAAIDLTAPVTGATPQTTVSDNGQFTAITSWSPTVSGAFAPASQYAATITVTTDPGYTLTGVPTNFFSVSGATSVLNDAGSGDVNAVFPATSTPITEVEISGTPQVDVQLTVAPTPSVATASYQWKESQDGNSYNNITGATSSTYTSVAADQGMYIEVTVTGMGCYSGTITSPAVGPVAAAPAPVDSIIRPETTTFDLNPNGADHIPIAVTVTPNGDTLESITNGGYTLAATGATPDYTVSGDVYTIQESYLDNLTVSESPVTLTFNFSAGQPATLTITVEDTTPQNSGISFKPQSGSTITTADHITITVNPPLDTTCEAVYWNITGFPLTTGDHLYQDPGFTLPVSETVYAAVYSSTTGSWFDQASASFTVTAPITINRASIPLTAPARGAVPATAIADNGQYTATVAWSPPVTGTFAASTTYTATITITPDSGYTLAGVPEDFFTVAGATSVTNAAGSGTVYAVFPKTAATNNSSGSSSGGGTSHVVLSPTVETDAATSNTTSSAVLIGDVTSGGATAVTGYGFLWGTSDSSLTNTLQAGTDNRSGSFTATLGSLKAGTTYYFQAYATNSQGTADGAVMNFTTAAAPTTPVMPAPPAFSDVPETYWGYDAISSLGGQGYVSGYPDGTFRPNDDITRAEFVSIMDKALKLAPYTVPTPTFSDVSPGAWFDQMVETAVYAGIAKGFGDGTFRPESNITREELACVLVQALGQQDEAMADMSGKTDFTDDAGISAWARGFVVLAVKDGLLKGYPDGSFRPQGYATRAEACATIENFLKFNLSAK